MTWRHYLILAFLAAVGLGGWRHGRGGREVRAAGEVPGAARLGGGLPRGLERRGSGEAGAREEVARVLGSEEGGVVAGGGARRAREEGGGDAGDLGAAAGGAEAEVAAEATLAGETRADEKVADEKVAEGGEMAGARRWAVPRGAAGEGRPIFLREGVFLVGSAVEEGALRKAAALFEEAMEAAPSRDPEDGVYEDWWRAARQRGENYLRLALGWDRFNRMSRAALEGELGEK